MRAISEALPTRSSRVAHAPTVLVVEDEELVCQTTCEVLAQSGYQVLRSNTAGEAIALFEQHRGGIDLVLCDAVLPDQSGALLVEMFRREAPQLKVILCSGYPQGDLPPHGPVIAAAYFMTKPYSAHSLLAKIRDAFQEKAEDEKPGPGLTLAVSRQHRSALIRRPSKDDTRRYVTRG